MLGRSALLLFALLTFVPEGNGAISDTRRQLMFERKEICQALSSFSLVVTQGHCSGFAQLNCKAVIDGLKKTKKSFEKWWKDDLCNEGELKRVAEMSSKLVVSVWVEGAAGIKCDGQGYGCGYKISNTDWISAAGRALAKAAEEARGEEIGFCTDDLRSLGKGEPVMLEEARKEACSSGGEKQVFEERFSKMLQRSMHFSFREATANLCDWGADVKSSCPEGTKPKMKPTKSIDVLPETPEETAVDGMVIEEAESTPVEIPESSGEVETVPEEAESTPVETPESSGEVGTVPEEPESTPADTPESSGEVTTVSESAAKVTIGGTVPEVPAAVETPESSGEDASVTKISAKTTVEDGGKAPLPAAASTPGKVIEKAVGESQAEVAEEATPGPGEITDAFDNPLLDEIIIGVAPVQVPPEEVENGEDAVVEQDPYEAPEKAPSPSCTCAKDLCGGAKCNAFPFATCSTVSNNDDCSDCSAQFFIDSKEVSCGIELCKPKGSLCANKSLAKCCGVCCRCGSFFTKITAKKEGLELGFCQTGPTCDCLSGLRG